MHRDFVFDTRYAGDGFDFQSIEFPQGDVVAVEALLERAGVLDLVDLVFEPGCAFFRSRRRYTTRDEAERAMARFFELVARSAAL